LLTPDTDMPSFCAAEVKLVLLPTQTKIGIALRLSAEPFTFDISSTSV
jgi:hypothetical protein